MRQSTCRSFYSHLSEAVIPSVRPDRIVLVSEEDVLRAVKTKGRRSGGGGGSNRGQLILLSTTGPILHIYVTACLFPWRLCGWAPDIFLDCLLVVGGCIETIIVASAQSTFPGLMVHLQPAGGALRGASSHRNRPLEGAAGHPDRREWSVEEWLCGQEF